jgi:pimeloyl-ACP methyl ester carboxylesterase
MRISGGAAWRVLVGLGVVFVLVLAASCGGDDDDKAKGSDHTPAGSSDASESADGGAVVDPYDGHTSEVYDGTTNWLCHPDLADDECQDLSATSVDATAARQRADLEPAEDPAIDCFYVYPTVSSDPPPNSDLTPDEPERLTVGAQFAPFATTCRMFAPVYRQVVVAAVGTNDETSRETAYNDVLDAWQTYVSQYNDGRGVVLIGHSQGGFILRELVAQEIDGNPDLRNRMVSAILLGAAVLAPDGEDVGGSFQHVPACREKDQLGCVITYGSYPLAGPPPDDGIFGHADADGNRALCVDPVELAGGNGLADAILPKDLPLVGGLLGGQAIAVDTRYILLPELLEARCERAGEFDYFAAGRASPEDQRPVEAFLVQPLGANWGLHLQDVNLAMSDLLDIVAAQAEAFTQQN